MAQNGVQRRGGKGSEMRWPTLRLRGSSWEVYGRLAGQRRRRSFRTRKDAEAYAADLRAERAGLRSQASRDRRNLAVRVDNLSEAQRADVISALAILGEKHSLTDAAREYVRRMEAPAEGGEVEEVFTRWLEAKGKANRRPRTLRDAQSKVRPFVYEHQGRSVASLTTFDVEQWLDERDFTPVTRAAYLRQLHGFFAFALKRRFISVNPVAAIDKPSVERPRPRVFTVEETRRILGTAAAVAPEMVPYLAIGIFAGLRPENELGLLDWRDIDLVDRTIRVTAATAKKRRERFVDMSDNLLDWLRPYHQSEGQVFFSRRTLREIIRESGVSWSQDIMRHTFASYHLAIHKNAALTAMQLGHAGNASVLFEHYRNLVRPSAAKEFWRLRPADTGTLIRLGTGAAG